MLARLRIARRINLIPPLAALAILASAAIGLSPLRSQMIEDRQVMKAAGGAATDAGGKTFLSVLNSARSGSASGFHESRMMTRGMPTFPQAAQRTVFASTLHRNLKSLNQNL